MVGDTSSDIESFWRLAGVDRPVILASGSERRATILRSIGFPFRVVIPDVQEADYGPWDGGELLCSMAVGKAEAVAAAHPKEAVLSCDTVVRLGARVFGKPKNSQAASKILRLLSGKTHEVHTALCYLPAGDSQNRTITACTKVSFRFLTDEEITAYVKTGEPHDKAGAYGIQSVGGLWVKRLEGCYFNVVGLPLSELWDLIKIS